VGANVGLVTAGSLVPKRNTLKQNNALITRSISLFTSNNNCCEDHMHAVYGLRSKTLGKKKKFFRYPSRGHYLGKFVHTHANMQTIVSLLPLFFGNADLVGRNVIKHSEPGVISGFSEGDGLFEVTFEYFGDKEKFFNAGIQPLLVPEGATTNTAVLDVSSPELFDSVIEESPAVIVLFCEFDDRAANGNQKTCADLHKTMQLLKYQLSLIKGPEYPTPIVAKVLTSHSRKVVFLLAVVFSGRCEFRQEGLDGKNWIFRQGSFFLLLVCFYQHTNAFAA
jgi:hypothetical protein